MKAYERVRITIVLVSGLLALGLLTWGIGGAYLDLIGHSNTAKTANDNSSARKAGSSPSAVLILPEARFWTCQIGVFQNESNAEVRKEQFSVLNVKAEVIGRNPWLVCIGLGHSAADLESLKQALQERGISTLPKQIVLPKQTFRVAGNGSQLTAELLTNTNVVLSSGITTQALAKEKDLWDAGAAANPLRDLEALHEIYNQLREKNKPEDQFLAGLSLFFQYQMVINKLSGK